MVLSSDDKQRRVDAVKARVEQIQEKRLKPPEASPEVLEVEEGEND